MRIPSTKIEAAAATRDVRAYINQPWLDVERQRIVATDGHILAIVPIETDEGDASGPIPTEAIKAARKMYRHTPDAMGVFKANGAIAFPNGYTIPRPDGIGEFPDVDRLVPAVRMVECHCLRADCPAYEFDPDCATCGGTGQRPAAPDVVINADLLARLQAALCDQDAKYVGVRLFLARTPGGRIDTTGPIRVEVSTPGRVGVIMPMRD